MKNMALVFCMTLSILAISLPGDALARSKSSGSKKAGSYIEKTCKSKACFKKHPNGHYGFESGSKKK